MKDLFGKAIFDYQTNNNPEPIITETSISDTDQMDVGYLFRDFKAMPKIEQKALQLAKGKILDVGCGAGSHALYLQKKGYDVTGIDISPNAIKTCELRGLQKAFVKNILDIDTSKEENKYDTILLLMNGTGIFGTLVQIAKHLKQLKSLVKQNGQILIRYKNEIEEPFPWLYLDYNTLQTACYANGLQSELIMEGKHFDYLARITV